MPQKKTKNRRCRNAKISEFQLKKVVHCFAHKMTAKEATEKVRLSEPTIRHRYMQLRQLLYDHGCMRIEQKGAKERPARYIFERQYRGVKEEFAHLYEMEVLNRIFATKNFRGFKKFSASKESDMRQVKKFMRYNQSQKKYDIVEVLHDPNGIPGMHKTRPFELADCKLSSTILINELNLDPNESFFRMIWDLLLKHPLE